MPSIESNRAVAIIEAAANNGYAVPAMCCYNLEGIIASVRAAEAKRSPVIIQLFPLSIEYAGGILVHAAKDSADEATVPVAVHLDHAQSPEIVRKAADLNGFDGIMIDMSHYEKEENMAKTRELVQYCRERGIATEAEPGRINGGEDGVQDTGDLEGILTTPEQAEEFIALGIDWLAPAFGNVHGQYGPKGPQLDYDRLRKVHATTKGRVNLILHGANDFDGPLWQECIRSGISKCNVNDAMNGQYAKVQQAKALKSPLTEIMEEGTRAMQKAVEQHMDWMCSTGKADL